MKCSHCGEETRVLETRVVAPTTIRRRRVCKGCDRRISTLETAERDFVVKKRSGSIEPFDPLKVVRAIARSAHVLPVRGTDINAIVDRIEKRLLAESLDGPIPSSRIGAMVLEELRGLGDAGKLARIRFAMVFLGCSEGPEALSNAGEFLGWLGENYPLSEEADLLDGAPPMLVLKRDGRSAEPFSMDKLTRSIKVALKGRGGDQVRFRVSGTLAAEVAEVFDGQPLIATLQIGSEVLRVLRDLDGLAYLRYGATFKRINSPEYIALDARSVLAVEFDGFRHPSRGVQAEFDP